MKSKIYNESMDYDKESGDYYDFKNHKRNGLKNGEDVDEFDLSDEYDLIDEDEEDGEDF